MTETCCVTDCAKPAKTRGMCGMHVERVRSHGQTDLPRRPTLQEKFWLRVQKSGPGECWVWVGALTTTNYGSASHRGESNYAHRLSYEWHVGPIPIGFQIDHLCRNTRCVNPAHLEAVTPRENTLRGMSRGAIAVRTNRCHRGHELTDDNVHVRSDGHGRMCKRCYQARSRSLYERTKALAAELGLTVKQARPLLAKGRR